MNLVFQRDAPTPGASWQDVAQLLEVSGLAGREPEKLRLMFTGSFLCGFGFCDNILVATGRAISDGVASSAIYDVAVSPTHQGRGIGRAMMTFLLERLPERSVLLVSTPHQQGFYAKLGFRRLKTSWLKHEDPDFWERNGYFADDDLRLTDPR